MAKDDDQATSSAQPLLDEANGAAAEEHDETDAAEEGSRVNIQQEIYTHPDRAVRWLISKGALRLGSFKVQVSSIKAEHKRHCMYRLIDASLCVPGPPFSASLAL